MVYISIYLNFIIKVSTLLRKAFEDKDFNNKLKKFTGLSDLWKHLILTPNDYSY